MSTVAMDTYRLRSALKATGKSANFTADEIANAIDVSQEGADLLTRADFDARMTGIDARMAGFDATMERFNATMERFNARMAGFDARMDRLEARMTVFDAKIDLLRAEIKAEVKASQTQILLWLSGIMLVSNGAVIAVLARAVPLT
jgi:uncharacterized coiled-coil protein SlyX